MRRILILITMQDVETYEVVSPVDICETQIIFIPSTQKEYINKLR